MGEEGRENILKNMESGTQRQWFLPVFIVLGLLSLFFIVGKLGSPSNVQAQLQSDPESGVLVIPVQLGRDSYGLAMVDTAAQTLWIYELNNRGPAHNRLRLLAARSWRYDKMLENYNTAEPKPQQVKIILENLGLLPEEQQSKKQSKPAEPNE